MGVPANKTELQLAIQTNYDRLQKEILSISVDRTTEKELEGHAKNTLMSINNLLSYLIDWGELVLKWNKKKDNNGVVDFPETDYKWNELGKIAQKFYEDHKDEDFNSLKEKLNKTVEQILESIENKSNQDLYEVCWYEKWTLGRMIQFNTA